MKQASKKLLEAAAAVLNRHLATESEVTELLAGDHGGKVLGLINEILEEAAEGNTLVTAMESTGELYGFVPKSSISIPDPPPRTVPAGTVPPSPDDH
jgi:hypothetical protein